MLLASRCDGEVELYPVPVRQRHIVERAAAVAAAAAPWEHLPGVDKQAKRTWKKRTDKRPNVVFMLLDSLSRANWMRTMNETRDLLKSIE
jgi:hypothetical protein